MLVALPLLAGSAAATGWSVMAAINARQVASIPLDVEGVTFSELIDVNTSRSCQLTIEIKVESASAQEKDLPDPATGDPEYELRYAIPIEWAVLTEDDDQLWSANSELAWNSGGLTSATAEDVDVHGGTLTVEHLLEKFDVPPPGRIRIRADVGTDEMYQSQLISAKIHVHDNVSRHTATLLTAFLLGFIGMLLLFAGVFWTMFPQTIQKLFMGRSVKASETRTRVSIAAQTTPPPKKKPEPLTLWGWCQAIFCLAILGWFAGQPFVVAWDLPLLLAWPLGVIATTVILTLLSAVFDRDCRRLALQLIQLIWRLWPAWRRGSERVDFRAAQRAADATGRQFHVDHISVWTDSTSDVESLIPNMARRTRDLFAEITGFPESNERPWRLLCFASERAFRDYAFGNRRDVPRLAGYYSGFRCDRVTVCEDVASVLTDDLAGILAHEMSHHLLRSSMKKTQKPWLEEGLASIIGRDQDVELTAEGSRLRHWHAEAARSAVIDSRVLVTMTYHQLHERMGQWHDPSENAFSRRFYRQSEEFCRFLLNADRAGFQRLLQEGLPRKFDRLDQQFQQTFARSIDELMTDCMDAILAAPLPPFSSPPDSLKELMQTRLIDPLNSESTPKEDLQLYIRWIGSLGYPWGGRALYPLLDHSDPDVQHDVRLALENIVGEVRPENADGWVEWFGERTQSV